MVEVTLGLATMNAGMGMPGSNLKLLLDLVTKQPHSFDNIIIVDGDMTSEAEKTYAFYAAEAVKNGYTYPGIISIANKWSGSLKIQYDYIIDRIPFHTWWVMLDDDELPSQGLLQLCKQIRGSQLPNNILSISTPRVTCFTEDTQTFYPGEYIPTTARPNGQGVAGPRAHIFKKTDTLRFLHSPAGRHVVPYHNVDKSAYYIIGDDNNPIYHLHLKAPEMYVLNDCVKAIHDDDIKDPIIREEFRRVMANNGIRGMRDFLDKTYYYASRPVKKDFEDFCIKYKDHGAPEGRMFIWYYNISRPEQNPFPKEDWTFSLRKVLNPDWRRIYLENKKMGMNRVTSCTTTEYRTGNGCIT